MRDEALFFYQLLFPFSPLESSGIEDDSPMSYFSHVLILTNVYASISGGGSGMGHDWRNAITVPALVHWTGVPIRHGALEGKPGTIFSHWNAHDPCYDSAIEEVMTKERWKSMKRFFKLHKSSSSPCTASVDSGKKFLQPTHRECGYGTTQSPPNTPAVRGLEELFSAVLERFLQPPHAPHV